MVQPFGLQKDSSSSSCCLFSRLEAQDQSERVVSALKFDYHQPFLGNTSAFDSVKFDKISKSV